MYLFTSSLMSLFIMPIYVWLVIIMSLLVPVWMMYTYKLNYNLIDSIFYDNSMNSMLCFMTITLSLFILVSTGSMLNSYYFIMLIMLEMILCNCFMTNNLLLFFILFESSLLPLLLMMLSYGYQPERLMSILYLTMYTVLGSIPLLIFVLYIWFNMSTMIIPLMSMFSMKPSYLYLIVLIPFSVKLPIYSFHIWLPKAHVEAPLGGSMMLAGAMLKLGGYGMFLFSDLITYQSMVYSYMLIICLSLWGGLLSSFVCLYQMDIKSMIAYSSVVHMSMLVVSVLSNTSWGFMGSILIMISHGWVSSCLFMMAYSTYETTGSRSFMLTKGLLNYYPIFSLLWFIMVSVNMSFPPTINLMGELSSLAVMSYMSVYLTVVMLLIMFMSVLYNMYLYVYINHGSSNSYSNITSLPKSKWYTVSLVHLLPLLLILKLNLMY
uniref:NADH dehydrogenase subunit 4 n=1 Tax=Cochlostyla marinduquensis TaxID=2079772 RepID=UPI00233F53EC|nr:NADH dehydrogenase subunit 4 [Cochlostyla marinduquensis]UIX22056.1 NADH dehydrogenase subunit 4 [Cochlostyla marinduquensis]